MLTEQSLLANFYRTSLQKVPWNCSQHSLWIIFETLIFDLIWLNHMLTYELCIFVYQCIWQKTAAIKVKHKLINSPTREEICLFFYFWVNVCFKMEVSQIFTCGDNNWCFEGKHASPSAGKSDSSAIHCSFPGTRTESVSGYESLQQHRDLNPKSLDNILFHSAPHCHSPGPTQSRGIVCVNSMQGIMAHGMKPKRICQLLSQLLCFSIGSPLSLT